MRAPRSPTRTSPMPSARLSSRTTCARSTRSAAISISSCRFRASPGIEGTVMRFTDKVALITAAASGIGHATAQIIASEGGIVVGVDTDQGRLDKATAAIRDAGGRAHGRVANALDPTQARAVVDAVVRAPG